jgi:hypothetical protein
MQQQITFTFAWDPAEDDDSLADIERAAAEDGVTADQLITFAIHQFLDDRRCYLARPAGPTVEERLRALAIAAGATGDVAEMLDVLERVRAEMLEQERRR